MSLYRPGDQIVFKDYNGKRRTGQLRHFDPALLRLVLEEVDGAPQHKTITINQVICAKREPLVQQELWGE